MKVFNKILLSITFFLFLFPSVTNAMSATTGFSGNSSVYVGNNIEVVLSINTDTPLVAIQGNLSYDSSKLELVSQQSLAPFEIVANGNKVAGMDMTGSVSINGNARLIKLIFKAKTLGNTTISFVGSKQVSSNGSVPTTGCSKTISIVNPPSSNNNLSNLTISNGSINFNKNTTNYNVSVDAGVTSVNIGAIAEDSGAKVSGIGNRSLNYGNNAINITVTAPSGVTKTYTINVNRKDNRSNNNKLSNITINGGNLNPNFSSNTQEYSLEVPFSIVNLDIKAVAEDSKSKISLSGQNDLVSEETRDVNISVTAENGSVRTYTIHVTRGKDPNKVLATNNYLSSLNISVGILSPAFDKEKTNYMVYLPYEIDAINIDAQVEDTRYGVLVKEGPEKLNVGNNEYKFTVTAEDQSTRTYKVIVVRAASVDSEASTNSYLKELTLKNSKLLKSFDKNVYIHYYKKIDKELIINAVAEDENSSISISNVDDIYVITVEAPSMDKSIYILMPKTKSFNLIIIFISIIVSIGTLILGYQFGLKGKTEQVKKKKVRNKKEKQAD